MNVLSFGGGVQSTTLALMALERYNNINFDYIIFADTGAEPSFVYEHVKEVFEILESNGIKTVIVNNGSILDVKRDFVVIPMYVMHNNKSTILRRQCTREFKIKPIRDFLKSVGVNKNNPANLSIGITLDEISRIRDSDVSYIKHCYPLIDMRMRRQDCINWLQSRNYKVPLKSSCFFCPFHDNNYWKMLKTKYKEEFEKACEFDEKHRKLKRIDGECYIHRSLKPLREIDFEQQQTFEFEECSGYCMT